jgi:SAM-dependent methyltransferase
MTRTYNDSVDAWLRIRRSNKNSAHLYLEKPGLASLLPSDLSGKSILCVGVGSGEETEIYKSMGADQIVGIDSAEKLIEVAKSTYPEHEFQTMDMDTLDFEDEFFDIVVSSLALHYKESWTKVLAEVHRVLKPGGEFVFSTHHPIRWSLEKVKTEEGYDKVLGFRHNTKDRSLQTLGFYNTPKKVTTEFVKDLEVTFFHRPLQLMLGDLLNCPLVLNKVLEPKPIKEAKTLEPEFYRTNMHLPLFIIFKLVKNQS